MTEEKRPNVITLEDRRKLTVSGVDSVDSFSDDSIVLSISGSRLTIGGHKLKVTSFSQGNGNFSASGEISSVRFSASKKLSGLFR